jgi:hypothetical protein
MLISAASLVIGFIVLAYRKKSIAAAVLALAAAEGIVGTALLSDATSRRRAKTERRRADAEELELFDDAECRTAVAHMASVLGGRHDEGEPTSLLREIPRDEEATEADFQV